MIYVSTLFKTKITRKWRYPYACHLLADTLRELHFFAGQIGLKRNWFQPKSTPHYDLTANKRTLAIKFGAKPIPRIVEAELIPILREKCI